MLITTVADLRKEIEAHFAEIYGRLAMIENLLKADNFETKYARQLKGAVDDR